MPAMIVRLTVHGSGAMSSLVPPGQGLSPQPLYSHEPRRARCRRGRGERSGGADLLHLTLVRCFDPEP